MVTKVPITGGVVLPDDTAPGSAVAYFTLSGIDTATDEVIFPATIAATLDIDGLLPPTFALWRNTQGLRGTSYAFRLKVVTTDLLTGRQTTQISDPVQIQVGPSASYLLSDLINNPVPATPSFNVNLEGQVYADLLADIAQITSLSLTLLSAEANTVSVAASTGPFTPFATKAAANAAIAGIAANAFVEVQADESLSGVRTRYQKVTGSYVLVANLSDQFPIVDGTALLPALRFASNLNTGIYRIGANILGISTNGTEQARFTTSGMQLTGLLSGTAVTQSQIDGTAGRLLKTGDFGIGGLPGLIGNMSVVDNSILSGIYRYLSVSGSSGGPIGSTNGVFLHTKRSFAAGEYQLFLSEAGAARGVWSRARQSGAWTEWEKLFSNGNILAAVSQTGGIPTGGILETGSNANGRFERRADGVLECWHTLTMTAGAGVVWTFPAAFIDANISVLGTSIATVASTPVMDAAPSATSVTMSARSNTNARLASVVHLHAIGRWSLMT